MTKHVSDLIIIKKLVLVSMRTVFLLPRLVSYGIISERIFVMIMILSGKVLKQHLFLVLMLRIMGLIFLLQIFQVFFLTLSECISRLICLLGKKARLIKIVFLKNKFNLQNIFSREKLHGLL